MNHKYKKGDKIYISAHASQFKRAALLENEPDFYEKLHVISSIEKFHYLYIYKIVANCGDGYLFKESELYTLKDKLNMLGGK